MTALGGLSAARGHTGTKDDTGGRVPRILASRQLSEVGAGNASLVGQMND